MLKQILSAESCARCRYCCIFTKEDIWEIPFITSELKQYISDNIMRDCTFVPYRDGHVFKMDFMPDGNAYCPMLVGKGCILGDEKPFDCKIWPFRVMRKKNGKLVLALSTDCPSVATIPSKDLNNFLNSGFADMVFNEAEKNPAIIKDYVNTYLPVATKG